MLHPWRVHLQGSAVAACAGAMYCYSCGQGVCLAASRRVDGSLRYEPEAITRSPAQSLRVGSLSSPPRHTLTAIPSQASSRLPFDAVPRAGCGGQQRQLPAGLEPSTNGRDEHLTTAGH